MQSRNPLLHRALTHSAIASTSYKQLGFSNYFKNKKTIKDSPQKGYNLNRDLVFDCFSSQIQENLMRRFRLQLLGLLVTTVLLTVISTIIVADIEHKRNEVKFLGMEPRFPGLQSKLLQIFLNKRSFSSTQVKRQSKEIAVAYLIHSLQRQIETEWQERYNERMKRLIARKSVIKRLLENPEKLKNVIETCKTSTLEDIWKLAATKYILYFVCYTGAYQGGGTFFIFHDESGIQSEPLQLKTLDVHTVHRSEEVIQEIARSQENTKIVDGYPSFDEDTKQLYITFRSGGQWNSYFSTRYSFENDQPILREYIYGYQNINSKPQERPFMTERYIRNQHGWFLSKQKRCTWVVKPDGQGLDDC